MLTNLGSSKCHSIETQAPQFSHNILVIGLQLSQHLLTLCSCGLDATNHVEGTLGQVISVTVHDLVE